MSQEYDYEGYDYDFEDNKPATQNNKQVENKSQAISVEVSINHQQKASQVSAKKISNDVSTKGKLIEQHKKLKGQLKELAEKMDQILLKQREKRKKKFYGNPVDDDQRVIKLKKQLQEQAVIIQRHKNEVGKLRRNLDNRYDLVKIVEKENEHKHLKKQLQGLEAQMQSLQKIRKTQDQVSRKQEDKQFAAKKSRMEEELRELNQKNKERYMEINEKQRQVRKLHESYILKEQRIKEIEAKLKENKPINDDISTSAISQIEEEIKQIDKERLQIEREGNDRLRFLEREKKQLKHELQRKRLILQEKEKDLKLNQLKHKQILRLISSSQATNHSAVAESRVQKQNKGENRRVVSKKGRQTPNIEGQEEAKEETPPKEERKHLVEKQDFGFSVNRDEEIIEDD